MDPLLSDRCKKKHLYQPRILNPPPPTPDVGQWSLSMMQTMAKDSRCVHAQTKNLEWGQAADFTESDDSGTRDAGIKERDEDISLPCRFSCSLVQFHFSHL